MSRNMNRRGISAHPRLCSHCDCRIKFVDRARGVMVCPGCGTATTFGFRETLAEIAQFPSDACLVEPDLPPASVGTPLRAGRDP